MPDLPTLTVSAAQAQKLVEVFGSVQEYKDWLKSSLAREVRMRKLAEQELAFEQNVATEFSEIIDPPPA